MVAVSDDLDGMATGGWPHQGNRLHHKCCARCQAVVVITLTVLHPIHVEQGFLVGQQSCVGGRSALVFDPGHDRVALPLSDSRWLRPDIFYD